MLSDVLELRSQIALNIPTLPCRRVLLGGVANWINSRRGSDVVQPVREGGPGKRKVTERAKQSENIVESKRRKSSEKRKRRNGGTVKSMKGERKGKRGRELAVRRMKLISTRRSKGK